MSQLPKLQSNSKGRTSPREKESKDRLQVSPMCNYSETNEVEVNMLDSKSVDEFLHYCKTKHDASKVLTHIARQLKACRAFNNLFTNVFSEPFNGDLIMRIIDQAYHVVSCKLIVFMYLDSQSFELVASHSCEVGMRGIRVAAGLGIEGNINLLSIMCSNIPKGDVVQKKRSSTVHDVSLDSRTDLELYNKLRIRAKSVLCAPVVSDELVIGVVVAITELGDDNKFTSCDVSNMENIGRCIALATILNRSTQSNQLESISNEAKSFSPASLLDQSTETMLENTINDAYRTLGADKISLFLSRTTTDELTCVVSPDIKGLSLPNNSGLVGFSFTNAMSINTSNAQKDQRHNSEVDARAGYTTNSLLTVPIIGYDGAPYGVLQAVNKLDGIEFSCHDEEVMNDICRRVALQINEMQNRANQKRHQTILCNIRGFAEKVKVIDSLSIPEILCDMEMYSKQLCKCDRVYFYSVRDCEQSGSNRNTSTYDHSSLNGGTNRTSLVNIPTRGETGISISLSNVHGVIIEALKSGQVRDFSSKDRNNLTRLLPEVMVSHAIIVPLSNNLSMEEHTCSSVDVILFTRSGSSPCFHQDEREGLVVLSQVLDNALKTHASVSNNRRLSMDWADTALSLSNALSKSQYVSFLISSEGFVLKYTKDFENLFSISGDDLKSFRLHTILNSSNVEFAKDIQDAVKSGTEIERKNSSLCDSSRQNYFLVDYSISLDENRYSFTSESVYDVIIHVKERFEYGSTSSARSPRSKSTNNIGNLPQINGTHISPGSKSSNNILASVNEDGNQQHHALSPRSNGISSSSSSSAKHRIVQVPSDPQGREELELIDTWDFNVLKIKSKEHLYTAITCCMERLIDWDDIGIKKISFQSYLRVIDETYHQNPFHNFHHASCVTHFIHMLLKVTNAITIVSDLNVFAIMLSAIVHDVDHPGNTNLFEINKGSELALVYNDMSVLENHHCATAFQLMKTRNLNLFENLTFAKKGEARKTIVSCIMATDMAFHVTLVEEMAQRTKSSEPWRIDSTSERILFGKILLHAADLSNPVRPFSIAKEWAARVSDEFNKQGEKEKSLGLPVSTFLLTPDTKSMAKNEIYFTSQVVAPMWRGMSSLFPSIHHLVTRVENNIESWKDLLDKLE